MRIDRTDLEVPPDTKTVRKKVRRKTGSSSDHRRMYMECQDRLGLCDRKETLTLRRNASRVFRGRGVGWVRKSRI